VYASPKDYQPETHNLFHNDATADLPHVSEASGIAAHPGNGMECFRPISTTMATRHLRGNDVSQNFLFRNQGNGTFLEDGLVSGVA